MRQANLMGIPIVAKRPSGTRLEEMSNRIGALEECVQVLRGVEERVRVLEAEYEALMLDTPKRRQPGHETHQQTADAQRSE